MRRNITLILALTWGAVCANDGLVREYVQTNEFLKAVSVPVRVVEGDEHAAEADREDVDFALDDFVNDAIGVSGKRRAA